MEILDNFFGNEKSNEVFTKLIQIVFVLIVCIIIIFVIGYLFDMLNKDKYKAPVDYYRTLSQSVGGGEEYYYKYWAWQPNKKKFYKNVLLQRHNINRPYTRHARKKNKYIKSNIPFRKEIYGKAV